MPYPNTTAPAKPTWLTGQRLFWLLSVGLLASAGAYDTLKDHWQQPLQTLTVPWLVSFAVVAILGMAMVPMLQRLKTGQIIREEGPQSHLKKSGTPTMGGIFFVPTGLGLSLLWTAVAQGHLSATVGAIALLVLWYAAIGWWDDWQVLRRQSNKGLSARLRLVLEGMGAALFCAWLVVSDPTATVVTAPWGWVWPLGLAFIPLAIFVPMAEGNALNLTDGLDGLAAGTAAIALLALGMVLTPHPDLQILAAAMSGACGGFLWHNHHPARVFMGDTGSLALGALLAGIGLAGHQLWELFIVSGLFFVESLSVIAQVLYYKATKGPDGVGKRLLRMAPLHHHFELGGWSELQVVGTFYGIAALLGLLCGLLKWLA
ncbi:phospho-N-acetylmuramoyl-pentapeptide-transferase [Thermosynechococcus sp.]|uniref:phospho-N-acetylmuramoyl-pentapeptide- transferase n=1 Tax=Thermosynechococcus sp. TaxID=2814275 RepID=UPI00391AF9E8